MTQCTMQVQRNTEAEGEKSQPALKVATPTSYAASGYNKTYTELELESSAFQTEIIKKYVYHTYVWSPYIYDLLK